MVTAPDPHQRIGQGLLENFAVAVPGIKTEHVAVIVTLRLQRRPQLSRIRGGRLMACGGKRSATPPLSAQPISLAPALEFLCDLEQDESHDRLC